MLNFHYLYYYFFVGGDFTRGDGTGGIFFSLFITIDKEYFIIQV